MSLEAQIEEQTKMFRDIIDFMAECRPAIQRVLNLLPPDVVGSVKMHVGTCFIPDFDGSCIIDRVAEVSDLHPYDCLPCRLRSSVSAFWSNSRRANTVALVVRQSGPNQCDWLCVQDAEQDRKFALHDRMDFARIAEELELLLRRHGWLAE